MENNTGVYSFVESFAAEFNFYADKTHRKLKDDLTNLKMDKTEILSFIKYQQKISKTLKEIH